MKLSIQGDESLTEEEIESAFNKFFIDDGYSFCLSDNRLKSIKTEHIEKTPELNWCQLKFSNCNRKPYNISVATLDSPQSNKKFISELNKFNFKTLKEICRTLDLKDEGIKSFLKKRLIRLRIDNILTGKPIITINKL